MIGWVGRPVVELEQLPVGTSSAVVVAEVDRWNGRTVPV